MEPAPLRRGGDFLPPRRRVYYRLALLLVLCFVLTVAFVFVLAAAVVLAVAVVFAFAVALNLKFQISNSSVDIPFATVQRAIVSSRIPAPFAG